MLTKILTTTFVALVLLLGVLILASINCVALTEFINLVIKTIKSIFKKGEKND